jgi:hypothetical protein
MKKSLFTITAGLLLASGALFAQLPQPYTTVVTVPYVPYFLPNAWEVLGTFTSINGSVFVDVNSKDGAAARFIAGNGPAGIVVYNISSWNGLGNYQQFLSNVIQENSTSIVPIRMASVEAAVGLNVVADQVYLNTSDPRILINDITVWVPHLSSVGVISGDNWNIPEIALAVAQAAENLGLSVATFGTFWTLSK